MKKFTFLILVALFTRGEIRAQSLVDTNKLWRVVECLTGGDCFTHSYSFQGDTTFGIYQYKKLYNTLDSGMTNWWYLGAMREDSTKKVYYRTSGNESLLYDFGLNENDTFTTSINGCAIQLIVDSVDTVLLLNGESRKRLFLFGSQPEIWIDGIGSLLGPPNAGIYFCLFDVELTLNCFTEDSILKYHDVNFNSCYFATTGIRELPDPVVWTLSQNPFADYTILSCPNLMNENRTLIIYDLPGHSVKEIKNISSEQILIDRAKLRNGFYLFKLLNGKQPIASGKLIVQ